MRTSILWLVPIIWAVNCLGQVSGPPVPAISNGAKTTILDVPSSHLEPLNNGAAKAGNQMIMRNVFKPFEIGELQVTSGTKYEPGVVFCRKGEQYVFPQGDGLVYLHPVARRDGRTVFFIVDRYTVNGSGNEIYSIGLNYVCVAQFDVPDKTSPLTEIMERRFLNFKSLPRLTGEPSAWVENVREVADDGLSIIIDVKYPSETSVGNRTYVKHRSYRFRVKDEVLELVSSQHE